MLVLIGLLFSLLPGASVAQTQSGFVIEVTVEGLQRGEVAVLRLSPGIPETAASVAMQRITLPEFSVGNGRSQVRIPAIPDGFYELTVQGPWAYLRKPEGYYFLVLGGQIVLDERSTFPLPFELVPPSAQELPPCRVFFMMQGSASSGPPGDHILEEESICWAEGIIDLYGPPKQPEPEEESGGDKEDPGGGSILSTGYHYVGPRTSRDNKGVWGRNYVVDPSVTRGGPHEFVAERVYAARGSNWIEAGWAEVSWEEDKQYVYEYDSATRKWVLFKVLFSISSGSPVETRVRYISSISKWRATYYTGTGWATLAEVSLGFTTADWGYNRGEIYTADGTHPSLPSSTFDKGYLRISGVWELWDTRYSTSVASDSPYGIKMVSQYYNFKIFSK